MLALYKKNNIVYVDSPTFFGHVVGGSGSCLPAVILVVAAAAAQRWWWWW
jgi:hypothetical protein